MTNTELLNLVKQNLEVAGDDFDDELNHLIESAEADISAACDAEFNPDNQVEVNAVVLYCRANFGEGNETAWKRYAERLSVIGTRKIVR